MAIFTGSGVAIVTPYYNKCTQQGLIQHYTAIAKEAKAPIIMYSVGSRTGVNIAPETVATLVKNVDNIVGIKEASTDITKITKIIRECGNDLALWSGNDDLITPVMSLGGSGVISTVANIAPADTSRMVHTWLEDDIETSRQIQLALKPLIDTLFAEVNPIPVKAALSMMNKIKPEYRLPLCEAGSKTLYDLMNQMNDYGLIE